MKKLLPLLLLCCFGMKAQAQTLYPARDVAKLRALATTVGTDLKIIQPDSLAKAVDILRPYFPAIASTMTQSQFLAIINQNNAANANYNPFLANVIDVSGSASAGVLGNAIGSITSGGGFSNAISSIGATDVSTYADGLARFMVERAKEELSVAFFEKLKKKLSQVVELRVLFPDTYELLVAIDQQIYHYDQYLASLRTAFQHDLSNIYLNLPRLMDEPKYVDLLKDFPELRVILKSGLYVMNGLRDGKHPGEILNSMPKVFGPDTIPQNIYSSLQVLNTLSQSFRTSTTGRYWLPKDSADQVVDDLASFKLYMGLLYQITPDDIEFKKANNSTFNYRTEMGKYGQTAVALTDSTRYLITSCLYAIDEVRTAVNTVSDLKAAADANPSVQDYFSIYEGFNDLLDQMGKVNHLPYLNITVPPRLNTFVFVIDGLGDIYLSVQDQDYSTAVLKVAQVYDTIFNPDYGRAQLKTLADGTTDVAMQTRMKAHADTLKDGKDISALVRTYGAFMASVVQAETAEEVQAAIEAAVLPVGSYRIKRTSKWNFAIQSYLGGAAGEEYHSGTAETDRVYAVSGLVGLSFSRGLLYDGGRKTFGSLGIYGTLVDVGAIAAYRLDDSNTADLPEVQLQNILAPGAYVVWGIGKSPLAIGFGVQSGPALRSVTDSQNAVIEGNTFRQGVFLSVDIPLFNIWNKAN